MLTLSLNISNISRNWKKEDNISRKIKKNKNQCIQKNVC